MNQYTEFELDNLFDQHFFSNLDYFFARTMGKAFNENNNIVLVSCALVSKSLFEGHICLDIKQMSKIVRVISETGKGRVKFPDFNVWISALHNSPMVYSPL